MTTLNHLNPSDIKVHPVTNSNPALLETLVQMFVEIFPHDRRYTGYIRECAGLAQRGGTSLAVIHQWIFEYRGEYVGFRLYNYLRQRNFGFSRYFGLLPPYRGYGLGQILHRLTVEQIGCDAASLNHPIPLGLCGELDHPAAAPDRQEKQTRENRLEIYRRMGAIILDKVTYFEPYLVQGIQVDKTPVSPETEPDRMLLYLSPLQPITTLTPELMTQLVTGVLVDNYRLSEDSWYMLQALASIRQLGEDTPAAA